MSVSPTGMTLDDQQRDAIDAASRRHGGLDNKAVCDRCFTT
jgi:hypothetical protein